MFYEVIVLDNIEESKLKKIKYKEISNFDLKEIFKERKSDTHKGDYGYVGIMGGCMEYSGAIKLANMSAASIRSGCRSCKINCAKKYRAIYCTIFIRTNNVPNFK